ncbi:uncharacterized protein LOC134284201 [Aedes albopictus]|uniref:Ionotropic glutamate receptor C-terminal domain-containing protein n=1 Tax=Aedes albopictus TaxID=7160 RepID=A0ABM1ZG46_AEDAL
MFTGHHRFGLIVDLSCSSAHDLLRFCSERSYFNGSYRWLLLNSVDTNDTFSYLESMNLNIDTRLSFIDRNLNSDESSFVWYEVYGTIRKRGGKNHIIKIDNVSSKTAVQETDPNFGFRKRTCLNGVVLQAVVATPQRKIFRKSSPIEDYLLNVNPPGGYTTDRMGYQMSVLLSESLNFKIQLINADEWNFNALETNSTKGVVGQLQRHLADFSISPLELTQERSAAYDVTVSVIADRSVIIFRHPKNSFTRNVFLLPLRNTVWIAVLMTMIVTSLFLLAVLCVRHRVDFVSAGEVLLTVLGFLSRQPSISETNLASARIMVIAVILFCFMIYQFYSTFIISYLLVSPPKTIQTLEDLLSSNHRCSIEDSKYNRDFFNKTNDVTVQKLYNHKILPNKHGFTNITTGLSMVQRGGYAFLMDCSYGYPLIGDTFSEQQICELQEIGMLPAKPLYISVPKGSPLREVFRVVLRRITETGLADYYGRIFRSRKPHCTMVDVAFDQVKLGEIVSLYWFLAVGGALALGILLVEIVEFRVRTFLEMRDIQRKYPKWLDFDQLSTETTNCIRLEFAATYHLTFINDYGYQVHSTVTFHYGQLRLVDSSTIDSTPLQEMQGLFVLLIVCGLSRAAINVDLFKDYLKWRNVKIVTVFHCVNQNDVFDLYSKMTTSSSEKIHFSDISNFTAAIWNHTHIMRYDYHKLGASVDMGCPETPKLFGVMSKYEYFNASYYWLVFANGTLDEAACLLSEQNLNVDAKVTLVVDQGVQQDAFDVYDVFSPSIRRGATLNTTLIGTWSREIGFTIAVNQSEYERRVDLRGISLKSAVTTLDQLHHHTLMQFLASNETKREYSFHKLGYHMLAFLVEKHNFSVEYIRNSNWGLNSTDGRSSQGVIGQVATKKVDFTVNVFIHTTERIGLTDHTVNVGLPRWLLLFRHPRINEGHFFFLQPFRLDLWIAILVIGFLAVLVTYFSYNDPRSENRSLAWLTVFGFLFQQGWNLVCADCYITYNISLLVGTSSIISHSSTRITLLSVLVFSFLISQFYSAYIVGYLLIVPPKTIRTLKNLLDSDLKVVVENLSYHKYYLNKTKDPIAVELYHKKILNGEDNFLNVTEGIARVKRGGYAFHCETAYVYPLIVQAFTDTEICDLQEMLLHPLRPLHFPLRKGSEFKEMFRITLRKATETGNMAYQRKFFFSDKPKCYKNQLETVSVGLDRLLTLFYGLLAAMAGSFIIMLLEMGHFMVVRNVR